MLLSIFQTEKGDASEKLLYANMTILTDEYCKQESYPAKYNKDSMLCIGDYDVGKSKMERKKMESIIGQFL